PCAVDEFCDEPTDTCVDNLDCNNNGVADPLDIFGGTSNDINTNNVPDECDECLNDNDCADTLFCNGVETCDVDTCVAGTDACLTGQTCDEAAATCPPTGADCNTNGIGDATDIAMGTSADLNTNSIPDECDDCFNDAGCDDGDFCNGAETCDTDTCQPGANPCLLGEVCDKPTDVCSQPDCNTNSIGDLDDIAAGTSDDTNTNGIPDECEGCTTDTECDDGLFCNGTEVCINSVCESPGGACQPGQSCNEDTDTCNAAGGGGGGGGPPPDGDGDGVSDGADDCPNTPTGESVDADGCSQSQLDDDEDGIANDVDQCADTPAAEIADVDTNGCAPSQLDDDVVIEPDPQPGPDDANTNGDDGTNPGDDTNTNGEVPDIGDNGMDDNGMADEPDSDGDGVPDRTDECALTPAGFEVNSVGCALIEPDPTDDAQDGCANGIGCGAGGLATLTMMMLGFGGLKVNRRRIRRTHR
ncbi:MAG: hypothetical protein GXP29_02280, partial [Planctomycetes bacterium]|nr:hypothetical protein [Planctomycetota bacterium]